MFKIQVPASSRQETGVAFQALAQAVKDLSVSPDNIATEQVLQQWKHLAKQAALTGNLANLKLLASLLRTLIPTYPNWEIYLHQYVGKLALIEGLYLQATTFFEKQLAEAQRQENTVEIVQAQIDLAEALLPQNRYVEVEELLKAAFDTSHRQRFYLSYVRALNRLGRLCHYRRKWDISELYLDQVLSLLQTYPEKSNLDTDALNDIELEEAFARHWIGANYAATRKWEEATTVLEESLKVRYLHRDLLAVVETMLMVGAVYQQLTQHDKALTCFEGSQAICQQLHCLPLSLEAYYYKASSYYTLGRYEEALAPARTAVEIGLKLKQSDWLARAYYILGRIYVHLKDEKAALKAHLEAAKLYEALTDDNPQWIELLVGVGDFLLALPDRMTEWEHALRCYQKAADIVEVNQQLEHLAPAMGKMGRAFLKVKGLDGVEEAARCYRLELRLAGDLESVVLPIPVAVALRVEALTGIQCCASLKINPNFDEPLDKLIKAPAPVIEPDIPPVFL